MAHLYSIIGSFLLLLLGGCAEDNHDVTPTLDTETDSESNAPTGNTDDGTDGTSGAEPDTESGAIDRDTESRAIDGDTASGDTQPDTGTDSETGTTDSGDSETLTETETIRGADSGEGTDSEWDSHTDRPADSEIVTDAETDAGVGTDSLKEGDAGVSTPWPDGKYITVDEVYERLTAADQDMLLINVVDEVFYNLGHIEGSLKITWDTLAANLDLVDAAKHIVLYCRRGVRSESAYDTLIEYDYPMVWVMEGGIEAWTQRGYSTVPD